jgi:putative endonuclease
MSIAVYYIYILESETDQVYYVGYTENVARRLVEHNCSNHETYSSKHRPWLIKASFEVNGTKRDAIRAEQFIKRQKSRKFIDEICAKGFVDIGVAQLVRVPNVRD